MYSEKIRYARVNVIWYTIYEKIFLFSSNVLKTSIPFKNVFQNTHILHCVATGQNVLYMRIQKSTTMTSNKLQQDKQLHQGFCTVYFALPHYAQLAQIIERQGLSMSAKEIDESICHDLLGRLRYLYSREIEENLAKTIMDDLNIYEDEDCPLPRNIEQQVAYATRLLFGFQKESLTYATQHCAGFELDEEDVDYYMTSEFQRAIEDCAPVGTQFRVTMGFYKQNSDTPVYEVTTNTIEGAAELLKESVIDDSIDSPQQEIE